MTTIVNTPQIQQKPMELDQQQDLTSSSLTNQRATLTRPANKPVYKGDPLNNPDLPPESRALLQAQQAMFKQNQAVSMAANMAKAKHDTAKAVINAMRV